MPVRTRSLRARKPLTEEQLTWLYDRDGDVSFRFFTAPGELAALWRANKAAVLKEWVRENPGSRPRRWWEYSAPEPRQRLGGIGTPAHECLAYAPRFALGIPMDWVSAWDATYYNGRAVDIHGNRIVTEYREGHFSGVPPDPNAPPLYESQAAYLRRLGLFLPGEEKRLTAADFEPYKLSI